MSEEGKVAILGTVRGSVLVGGTHTYTGKIVDRSLWFWPTQPFWLALKDRDYRPFGQHDPFVWTSDIGGLGWRRYTDWKAAGESLRHYCESKGRGRWLQAAGRGVPRVEADLFCHSHGGQAGVYATLRPVQTFRVRFLVTLAMPVREDMAKVYQKARDRLDQTGGKWLHLYGDRPGLFRGDYWQQWGGGWGPIREAHANLHVDGADHAAFKDPTCLDTKGWSILDTWREDLKRGSGQ